LQDINFKRLIAEDIALMKNIIESDGKKFLPQNIEKFLADDRVYAFGVKINNKIMGLIYGYSLIRMDNKPMFYIHEVDILPEYQNMGIGSKFIKYVIEYAKDNGFSKCFLITEKKNYRACRIYEKAGGINTNDDEIVYSYKF